jgi:hypothetical protein
MKKDLPFYFAFVICLFSFNAQATTVPLDSYLVVSNTPPLDVSYKYFPPSTAADYPGFRNKIGKITHGCKWFKPYVLFNPSRQ